MKTRSKERLPTAWHLKVQDEVKVQVKPIKLERISLIPPIFSKVLRLTNMQPPAAAAVLFFGLLTAENTRQSLFEIINNWSKNDRIVLIDSANDISFENIGPEGKSIGQCLEILSGLALQWLD